MILGACPYCNADFMIPTGRTGAYERRICDSCNKTSWLYHSRVDPHSYTDEDFKKLYDVNEETKTIRKKQQ